MNNTIIVLLGIFVLSLISCNKSNKQMHKQAQSLNINEQKFFSDSLKLVLDNVLKKNDTTTYKDLYKEFVVNGHKKEFLYYSMKMAELNNYGQAFFDTSTILANYNFESEFPHESKLTIYYLLKAYEAKNENAQSVIKEMYTDKGLKIPTSTSILEKK